MPERDEETGRYQPSFTDEEFLEAVDAASPPTTSNVAEEVDCKYRTAYKWLTDLEDNGKLEREKIGNTLVWLVPDGGEDNG
ncbi:ArsR family transcriptional regulator [Natronococcus wangiae]|uniref:ArsR family transcriptional regulator n=1 Tax=Natronococcus wangiae TaxID=3068275 RepID=UPI0027400A8D|nr:ArsR family transcriptional regulator [Natronococcus sp. AD5]